MSPTISNIRGYQFLRYMRPYSIVVLWDKSVVHTLGKDGIAYKCYPHSHSACSPDKGPCGHVLLAWPLETEQGISIQ